MNTITVAQSMPNMEMNGNTILIYNLNHAKCASEFLR